MFHDWQISRAKQTESFGRKFLLCTAVECRAFNLINTLPVAVDGHGHRNTFGASARVPVPVPAFLILWEI